MNMNYNAPYMDEYPSPEETARRLISNLSFNTPPSSAAFETSHENMFAEEELASNYVPLNNFETQFPENKSQGSKHIYLDQHKTVNIEQAISSNRSYDHGGWLFSDTASFDPCHQKGAYLLPFQEKGGQLLMNLDHQETGNKEQSTSLNRNYDQGGRLFNNTTAFNLRHQDGKHLLQYQEKCGLINQYHQETINKRQAASSNRSYDQRGWIFSNTASFDPCRQKGTHLLQSQEKGVQRQPQQKMSLRKFALLNNKCGRVEEENMGLKIETLQQNPLTNENVVRRLMNSTPSKNSGEVSYLQLKPQEEMTVAEQKALGSPLGISCVLNSDCSRYVKDSLGITRQKMPYTNESAVRRNFVISKFLVSIPEERSDVQLYGQEEMLSADDNALGRSSGDSRALKNIGTKITTDDTSNPFHKAEACRSTGENKGSLKIAYPQFSGKDNSDFGDLKETSKPWTDEKAQITSNFGRMSFSPYIPKDKSYPMAERDAHNLKKTAVAQKSAIFKLLKSYSERISHAKQKIRANGIRILNLRETPNEDTTQRVLDIFRKIMEVDVDFADIESCKRTSRDRDAYRPIIVRFFSSRIKTKIISNRIFLSGYLIRIDEELSNDRAQLMKRASSLFGRRNVGIKNGYIEVTLQDGNTVNFSTFSEFNAFVRTNVALY